MKRVVLIILPLFLFSQNYVLKKDVLSTGGRKMMSSNYILQGTISQTTIGDAEDANYKAMIGFWHPPEAVPPLAPYITQAEKSGSNVTFTWERITTDIFGNPEIMDYYVVYRNTSPSFIPDLSDSIGAVLHPDTTYTDAGVLNASQNYYYLIKAVDWAKNRSRKSNMGYVFQRAINENPGTTADRNWVNLPWHCEYDSVSQLTADLSPNAEAFNKVTNLDEETQNQFSYFWHAGLARWLGTNFAILPGHFYEFTGVKDTTLVVVGSHYPDSSRPINENPGVTADRNWVCLAYNAAYTTVSDITDELAPSGSPINKMTNLVDTLQAQFSYFYHTGLGQWLGTNFAIVPGHGYEMTAIKDSTWNPTEYTNDGGTLLARTSRQSDIKMYLGQLNDPDRAPVWSVERRPVNQASKKPIDYADCRLYESVKRSVEKVVGGRVPGISHLVIADLRSDEFENLVFTAYRPDRPYDVLTENMVGSGIAWQGDWRVMWFDVANFKEPWKDGEEIVLIIEATKQGRGYFTVLNVRLELGNELQSVGEISLMPIPEPKVTNGLVRWHGVENDNVVGYSIYQGDTRLNDEVINKEEHVALAAVNLKPVIKGGYETMCGSLGPQSTPPVELPISFSFTIQPNPFTRKTAIAYALPRAVEISIKIYDVSGRQVKNLVSEKCEPGYYQTHWFGNDDMGRKVSAGVYFIKMSTKEFESQRKVILVY